MPFLASQLDARDISKELRKCLHSSQPGLPLFPSTSWPLVYHSTFISGELAFWKSYLFCPVQVLSHSLPGNSYTYFWNLISAQISSFLCPNHRLRFCSGPELCSVPSQFSKFLELCLDFSLLHHDLNMVLMHI